MTPLDDAPTSTLSADGADATTSSGRQFHLIWCFGIGVGSALVGLLPWLVTGARLPVQNLWATSTSPELMPIALLPFSQYMLTLIVGLIVTGSALAGVLARATRARQPGRGLLVVLLGVVLVHLVAAAQTTVVVMNGLEPSNWADLYLAALVAVTFVSVLTGILVLLLIAKSPVPGATIGLGIAAIAAGIWASALAFPFGSVSTDATSWMLDIVRWIPAVIVGLALAWAGFRTVGRIIAAVAALLILWIAPTAFTAISAAAGMRVLGGAVGEMLDYGAGIFGMALWLPELALPPLILALLIAVVGWVVLRVLRARSDFSAPID